LVVSALLGGGVRGSLFAAFGGVAVKGRKEEKTMAKKVKEVKAKVVSVKGECGLGHKVGDIVTFTDRGVAGPICVHALYGMMPKVFAMMFNAEFPWAQDPDVLTHPCPDAANPVVFELKRIYED